jgi:DNA-binding transcriptional regulator YhcF (GntR family)
VKSPLHRAVTRRPQGGLAHGPLPSVKQLQQEHDVDRDTVLRAVEILRDEGLVFTVPWRGTYVSPDAK